MRDLLILNTIILNVLSDNSNILAMPNYGPNVHSVLQTVVSAYLFVTFSWQLRMMYWVRGTLVDKPLAMWL